MNDAVNNTLTGRCIAWMSGKLEALVEDVNKTARKLDLPEVSLTLSEPYAAEVTVYESYGARKKNKTFVDYTLVGVAPYVAGCQVVAHIDCSEASPIVFSLVDDNTEAELEAWRTGDVQACDHCGHNRNRHSVYILKNETNDVIQVGSTCLKDFIPVDIASLANRVLTLREVVSSWDEGLGGGTMLPDSFQTDHYLAACLLVCDLDGGFLSRSKANGFAPTADTAHALLLNLSHAQMTGAREVKQFSDLGRPEECDALVMTKYDEAVELRRALLDEIDPKNNFEHNLIAALRREFTGPKTMGLVAAAIPAARIRAENEARRIKRAEEIAERASEWVGEPKQRTEFDVTLEFRRTFEGYYGLTTLMKFVTDEGNILTWFTSSPADLTAGEKARIKATIKEHDEYDGEKQTKVTRVTVM